MRLILVGIFTLLSSQVWAKQFHCKMNFELLNTPKPKPVVEHTMQFLVDFNQPQSRDVFKIVSHNFRYCLPYVNNHGLYCRTHAFKFPGYGEHEVLIHINANQKSSDPQNPKNLLHFKASDVVAFKVSTKEALEHEYESLYLADTSENVFYKRKFQWFNYEKLGSVPTDVQQFLPQFQLKCL